MAVTDVTADVNIDVKSCIVYGTSHDSRLKEKAVLQPENQAIKAQACS